MPPERISVWSRPPGASRTNPRDLEGERRSSVSSVPRTRKPGTHAGFLGGAGFVGLFAFVFLSVAAALAISEGADLPFWAGFVCIGGAFGGLAGLLAMAGLGKVVKVKGPQRTIRTVKDDIAWAKHPTVAPDRELEELRATHR